MSSDPICSWQTAFMCTGVAEVLLWTCFSSNLLSITIAYILCTVPYPWPLQSRSKGTLEYSLLAIVSGKYSTISRLWYILEFRYLTPLMITNFPQLLPESFYEDSILRRGYRWSGDVWNLYKTSSGHLAFWQSNTLFALLTACYKLCLDIFLKYLIFQKSVLWGNVYLGFNIVNYASIQRSCSPQRTSKPAKKVCQHTVKIWEMAHPHKCQM